MQRIRGVLLVILVSGWLFTGSLMEAASTKSDVGISFNSELPIGPKNPIEEPFFPKTKPASLPQTSELIASIIWVLLGCSFLVSVIGLFMFKQVIINSNWE